MRPMAAAPDSKVLLGQTSHFWGVLHQHHTWHGVHTAGVTKCCGAHIAPATVYKQRVHL
jgi:hypothetical protein